MNGFLHLADGQTFQGSLIGSLPNGGISGEIVFFTGMTGYQEVLTDPSYTNQIIVFTYPLIGNYGINEQDFESARPHAAAVIVCEAARTAFHYEARHSFTEYLEKWGVPILEQIDTRELVKSIRQKGTMPALLSTGADCEVICDKMADLKVKQVSTTQPVTVGNGELHIVMIDFGFKKSIADQLASRNCTVTIVPYDYTYTQIRLLQPDGIVLSNGPGNPKELLGQLPEIKKMIEYFPVLGICLGHQLAALALGADTEKMRFGHRGANQPVYDISGNKVFMSSQNHSYAVNEESLKDTGLNIRFYNRNDHSIEGLGHMAYPLLTVQFHPEANPGPEDSVFIFNEYLETVKCKEWKEVSYA